MSGRSKDNIGELFADLVMSPFIAIEYVFSFLIVFSIFFSIYACYDSYVSDRCNECHDYVTKGEYCKTCGRLMTDSTTENHVWYW